MTTLIVKAIDSSAPGSHMERLKVVRAMRDLSRASSGTQDPAAGIAAMGAFVELNDLIRPRLRTENGADVDQVLAEMSMDDFDVLFGAMLSDLLGGSVPPESAAGSEDGAKEKRSTSPDG